MFRRQTSARRRPGGVRGLAAVGLVVATAMAAEAAAVDLVVGQQVKIEGHARSDGTFDATDVVLRDRDATAKIEGRVTGVRADRGGLELVGFDIVVTDRTLVYRGGAAGAAPTQIAAGTWLEAKGRWRGRTLIADRLRIKEVAEPTEELEGVIDSVDLTGATLTLLGRQVRLPHAVHIVDERGRDTADTSPLRRDDDDQSRQPIRLGSRVVVGGRVEAAFGQNANFALDDTGARDDRWSSRAQLLASTQLTASIEAYGKVSVNRSGAWRRQETPADGDVRVQEAYLLAHRVGGTPISLQVGRQRFRDGREWFFDEYLDAVRLTAALGAWTLEAAVTEGIFAGDVTARTRSDQRQTIAIATRAFGSGLRAAGYAIARHGRGPDDDDPWWLGTTLDMKRSAVRAWALGAIRRGRRAGTPLGGWAIDVGATGQLDQHRARPSLSLGYAFASGDSVAGDGRDTTFRQTDLEDNSARLGGLRRLTYYGELFDPELSNLQVLTVAVGARPGRRVGIDLVVHRYVQSVLRGSFPSSALDPEIVGRHGLLGHEADVAATFRAFGVDLDLSGGVFLPGPALGERRRMAFFWRPQVRLYF